MTTTLRVDEGILEWGEIKVGVGFNLEISRLGAISIQFDALNYSRDDKWGPTFQALSRLDRGEERRLSFFRLSGTTTTGESVSTDFATLRKFSPTFSNDGSARFVLEATAAEIIIGERNPYNMVVTTEVRVEYLTRAQMGFHAVAMDTELGRLSVGGPHDLATYTKQFGFLSIVRMGTASVEWVRACDDLADIILQVLSFAQGRRLEWVARSVYSEKRRQEQVIRPRQLRKQAYARVFHPLNLEPILQLAVSSSTKGKLQDTGLDVALSWMLAGSYSVEGQYLNLLVALEHLLSVFQSKAAGPLEGLVFEVVKSRLLNVVDSLAAAGDLPAVSAKIVRDRVLGMNRPSYWEKVLQIIDYYRVPVEDIRGELKFALYDCRNDLVHTGYLKRIGDDSAKIHRNHDVAEEFLKRLVMAILEFKGQYISALYNLESFVFGEGEVRELNLRRK